MAHHKSIVAEANEATIEDLHPGLLYKIVVEAVVSVKDAVTNTKDPEVEKQNRRTTHVVSKPVFVRTRAPCEPPRPIVTGLFLPFSGFFSFTHKQRSTNRGLNIAITIMHVMCLCRLHYKHYSVVLGKTVVVLSGG